MPMTVASVPYLNAKPLVWALERLGLESPVNVVFDVPSRLPRLLETKAADAILVSSIDALTVPGRRVASGCSISSLNKVMSVRVFSRVPFSMIESLALDASSMTSNALAKIVLKRMFGAVPDCTLRPPDGSAMLQDNDACVLIGDKGLMFDGTGLHCLDLGEAWHQLTGLPFVWACWVGGSGLSEELSSYLNWARFEGQQNLAAAAADADPSIPSHIAHEYLTTVFDYGLDGPQLEGLRTFAQAIAEDEIAPKVYEPALVEPNIAWAPLTPVMA